MKKIEPHERIAQFALLPKFNLTFEEVTKLNETTRGEGGFGSSGSK
jgi:dUTPase